MISAIILSGGRGDAIFPFSTIRNKVVLPILHTPIIRRLTSQLREIGIEDIHIITGYQEQSVRYALHDINHLLFIHQKENESPAEVIRSILTNLTSDDTLILYGDIVTTRENLSSFISHHTEIQSDVSILTSIQKPSPLHALFLDVGTNKKLNRLEFNKSLTENWFCGVLIGKTHLLKRFFDIEPGIVRSVPLGAMPIPQGDLVSTIDVMLEKNCEISCISAVDFVVDVDHPWDLLEANQKAMEYLFKNRDQSLIDKSAMISEGADISPHAKLWIQEGGKIEKGTVIKGNLFLGANSQLKYGALLEENVFVGSNTSIAEYAKIHRNSIIGEHNLILHNAEFFGLTLDTVFMVHSCCISGVIGSHVDIGAGSISATWRFDDKIREIRCKLRKETPPYHGNLTYLGDYCRTGVSTLFMPGVRIGSYSCIGPGVIVNEDIQPYSLVFQRQQLEIKPWGPDRYP